jgi:hypothetical protein
MLRDVQSLGQMHDVIVLPSCVQLAAAESVQRKNGSRCKLGHLQGIKHAPART